MLRSSDGSSTQLGQLKADLTETEGALNRLVSIVEKGLIDFDDPTLAERLKALKAKRRDLQNQIETTSTSQPAQQARLTEAKLAKLSTAVRTGLANADPDMRKAYIKLFVDKVIVSKTEIRLSGPKGVLAKAAMENLPNTPENLLLLFGSGVP
ncbi:MAG: hypothetical protein B7W99_02490 [Rhodospirillales bacterium 20-58-10]|nr:MAG: hypothetical protein B7W99_02490 [Rhodospirillales bacterium 20-58-10]